MSGELDEFLSAGYSQIVTQFKEDFMHVLKNFNCNILAPLCELIREWGMGKGVMVQYQTTEQDLSMLENLHKFPR